MSAPTTARKVVLYQLLSLDGVAEEPGDWFAGGGPELVEHLRETIATQDDVLLGRGTYDYWVGHWPSSDFEPFASFINGVRKHVVTSSPLAGDWANSTAVSAPLPDAVRALREQPGGDIGIHGSISLAQALLRERLVDELRLVVAPVLAGRGRRLFAEDGALARLERTRVEGSANGAVFLRYRPAA
jgi:dihydrofolate reductase